MGRAGMSSAAGGSGVWSIAPSATLYWDDVTDDYLPTAAKALTIPKTFIGPTHPAEVTGATFTAGKDVWLNTDAVDPA